MTTTGDNLGRFMVSEPTELLYTTFHLVDPLSQLSSRYMMTN